MKIYIAAPWVDRDQARQLSKVLEAQGHTITHPWWDKEQEGENYSEEYLIQCAEDDYAAVVTAELLVLLNLRKSEGKAVEQGIALASGIPIFAVGVKTNIFHRLSSYQWFETIQQVTDVLESPKIPMN